ncbi:MAG: M14 family zinc carboxypeptidase [Gemmatimonas sp.]
MARAFLRYPFLSTALGCASVLLALTGPAHAQTKAAPTRNAASSIPAPETVFGFPPGADNKLFTYDQSIEYFKRLAKAAPTRVKLLDVGKTSFGHSWTAVLISSPQNLAKIERYREINKRLARPDGLTDAQARALAKEGKAFVDISGGLHASEIAGSQHTPQLAYELLLKANEPEMKEILDNVIFFLWPSINPDGQDIVVNWCNARNAGTGALQAPMELYQKYVGHDNNRDSYMLNVVESRVVARTWREWEPQIIYAHHQSSPFPTRMWIPPFADPIGLYAPPIMSRQVNAIGTRIAAELDAKGQPGAVHMLATFDAYYPGYIDYMPMYQNIAAWWTETQGGNCGAPRTSTIADLPADYKSLMPTSMYASPWAEGTWTFKHQIDYMVTASIATLRYAARFREELLYNRYQSGRNTIEQYRKGPPYAYIVRQEQHDPMAPVELLRRLAFLGVNVKQLDADMTYEGTSYPKGTWVVPMDQEFAQLVRELLEVQKYPELGDDLPYDAAGWTLPFQMNVNVVEAKTPLSAEFRAAMKNVSGKADTWGASDQYPFTTNAMAAGIVAAPGAISGSGDAIVLDPAQNNSFRFINRAIAAGATLRVDTATASARARYIVSGVDAAKADSWAKELGLRAQRASAPASAVPAPVRIAMYKAAPGNMDEGWTEWLLDTHEFKYTLIGPQDIRAGNLGARFDAIVVGSQAISRGGGGRGGPPGGGAGGGGRGGAGGAVVEDTATLRAIDEFVRGGGTIVTWNGGSTSAIQALQLPVRNVLQGVGRQQYFTGSSVFRIQTDVAHPVMSGMPATADAMVSSSPVFATTEGFEGSVIAKYPATENPLRSGYLKGAALMQGYAAALDVKRGQGHIILMAFQPQWRGQPIGTFRTIFNSLFYARAVSATQRATSGFYSQPSR